MRRSSFCCSYGQQLSLNYFFGMLLRLVLLLYLSTVTLARAQDNVNAPLAEPVSAPEQAVSIAPLARDAEIAKRIREILLATQWYQQIQVRVDDGVVFLDGQAGNEEQQQWARNLAAKTQDVVAVVNRISVRSSPNWSFRPALQEIQRLGMKAIASLPLIVLAIIVLPLAWALSRLTYRLLFHSFRHQIASSFLREVVAKAIAMPILLLGIYLILQVAGLTKLAFSLVGGAGIIGIVIGFAFRDIAENFLASLLLSIRQPFSSGDLIDVASHQGIVQSMNTRSTILLSPEGNHIQIPNSTIFKSTIINFSASPTRRAILDIGIGYDAAVSDAQTVIMDVLEKHQAIMDKPDPLVLVDTLGAATVNLKIYVWIDGSKYEILKVKSSLMRLTKKALMDANISMPDEAREVIFPNGIPVTLHQEGESVLTDQRSPSSRPPLRKPPIAETSDEITEAEGDLMNEREELEEQVAGSILPEAEQDLLMSERPEKNSQ